MNGEQKRGMNGNEQIPESSGGERSGASGLRTFSSDVAGAIKKQQGSVIKIAVAEYERRQREHENISPGSKKNVFLLAGGIIFLIATAGLLLYALLSDSEEDGAPAPEPIRNSLVYADIHTELAIDGLTGSRLAERLQKQSLLDGKPGVIENIYLTENGGTVGAGRFLALFNTHIPPGLARSLTNELMIGSYKTTGIKHAFIIFQTRDFANAFTGMLGWEERLWEDFYKFPGTETLSQTSELEKTKFEDLLIKNKNARALKRADDTIALLYIFLDEKNILITDGVETVAETLTREMLR